MLTWGRGFTCISVPIGPLWVPDEGLKPYHGSLTPPILVDNTEGEVPTSWGPDRLADPDGHDQMTMLDPSPSPESGEDGQGDHSTT